MMTQTTSESSTPPCSEDLIAEINAETPEGVPAKPKTDKGFELPVAWLGGRELVASLKLIILYSLFGSKLDSRDWMTGMVNPFRDDAAQALDLTECRQTLGATEAEWDEVYARIVPTEKAEGEPGPDEFWFDYVADSGDGQMPTYNIAYLCMRPLLIPTREGETSLPRGKFLFVGGDTAYHVADYETLAKRFQAPFWWAYKDLVCEGAIPGAEMSTRRPIFAIPGNHDYYDVLDGFNRQFRRPSSSDDDTSTSGPLLQLPTFERYQEASYVALRLPFSWWFWGLDIERSDIDFRQQAFFKKLNKKYKPKKLIIATPSPITVFGKYLAKDKPLTKVFEELGLRRPFLKAKEKEKTDELERGECRLDLSGDVHHYARYWGPRTDGDPKGKPRGEQDKDRAFDNSYASVVSGGGGAFFDPTNTNFGEIKEQALYPTVSESLTAMSKEILDFSNIRRGGFVHYSGAFISFLICFAAIIAPNTRGVLFPNLDPQNGISIISLGLVMHPVVISLLLLIPGNLFFEWALKKIDQHSKDREPQVKDKQVRLQKKIAFTQGLLVFLYTTATFLLMLLGIRSFRSQRPLTALSYSLLIFLSTVWAALMAILYLQYTEWLNRQAKERPIEKRDYGPAWLMLTSAALIFCAGLWFFGQGQSALPAPLFADMAFMTVVSAVPLGLIVGLALSVGGGRHDGTGKLGYVVMGSWHTVLHLLIPLLWTLSIYYYFHRQGISTFKGIFTWKGIQFVLLAVLILWVTYLVFRWFGIRHVSRNHRKSLVATWTVYGLLMIFLPTLYLFWERSERGVITTQELIQTPVQWRLGFCFAAVLIGAFMSCVWFGWYLAVALVFNGHNNEAGGAARLQGYKQFMRIRLRKDDLTAYVIGFDKAQAEGKDLLPNLRLIDQFTLTVKSN